MVHAQVSVRIFNKNYEGHLVINRIFHLIVINKAKIKGQTLILLLNKVFRIGPVIEPVSLSVQGSIGRIGVGPV
jgi:hypothetical protein